MDTTPITAQDDKDVLILTIEMPFRGITTTVTVPAIEVAMGEVFMADQGGKYSSVIDMIIKHLKESLINPINQTYGHRTPLFADVVAAYGPRQSGCEVDVRGTLQCAPQVVPAGHVPQSAMRPPHPSPVGPQVMPSCAQVFFTHDPEPHTPGTPPPPQVLPVGQVPQRSVPPQPSNTPSVVSKLESSHRLMFATPEAEAV